MDDSLASRDSTADSWCSKSGYRLPLGRLQTNPCREYVAIAAPSVREQHRSEELSLPFGWNHSHAGRRPNADGAADRSRMQGRFNKRAALDPTIPDKLEAL